MLLYYKENKKERLAMTRIRCGYCGKYYDDGYTGALDNGSPACPECVADEEAEEERKREISWNDIFEYRKQCTIYNVTSLFTLCIELFSYKI